MTEINLKDLQSVLRTTLGNELIVESYVTKDLLPPGENYGSKIVSVQAVIKRGLNDITEKLYLIGKLPPETEFQRELFKSPYTFPKEIFMYAEILPFYRKLEIQYGAEENDTLAISPTYYGSRLSMNPDEEFDDDAVILLENLKPRGYYCVERRLGCDWNHARLAVEAMARFHALGLATKEKDPEFFQIVKFRSKSLDFTADEEWMKILKHSVKTISDDPDISIYLESCLKMTEAYDQSVWTAIPSEPWSTIIHSDFWVNNILFYRDNDAAGPRDIKFIDYQNYLFLSPARELTFFLGCGLNHELIHKITELIEIYYYTLIEKLKTLDCNIEPYSQESFYKRIKEDAAIEFTHSLFMMKIITMDINVDDPVCKDALDLIKNGECGEAYRAKLKDLIIIYRNQNWLLN